MRNRMKHFPAFDTTGFRNCQITAIENLEKSFAANRPKALIQMATGAGKTFTAITAVYRLLKFTGVNRVLFLVDTKGLGEQAEREFLAYRPNDDNRSFFELYGVRRLKSSFIPSDAQVCISTIQRMYSILRGEELDDSAEQESLNENPSVDRQSPKEVVYNAKYPPEFFDVIIPVFFLLPCFGVFPKNRTGDAIGCTFVCFRDDMCVDIRGGGGLSVSQPLRHRHNVLSILNQDRGHAVSEGVRVNVR